MGGDIRNGKPFGARAACTLSDLSAARPERMMSVISTQRIAFLFRSIDPTILQPPNSLLKAHLFLFSD